MQTAPAPVELTARAPTRSRLALSIKIGGFVLGTIVLLAAIAPLISKYDPTFIQPRLRLRPPNEVFWFGSDSIGRDVFSRVMYGARLSLLVGLLAAVAGAVAGTLVGLLSGGFRALDPILMRIMDGVMAIPSLLLAVALVSLVGPSLLSIVTAIAFSEVPRVARLVRSVVLTVREEPFVRAAEGLGLPRALVLFRHILPSCAGPLIVQTTFMFAAAILAESVLGFLGVGFPPELPTWGNILAEGRTVFQRAPWTIFFPAFFLSATVLAVNMLGDGLRDQLDPKLARKWKVGA